MSILHTLQKNILLVAITVVVSGVFVYFSFFKETLPDVDFVVVQKSDVVQEVSATGRVRPNTRVDLAFEKTGKIASIFVGVGERVVRGQTLIRLDNSDVYAELGKARANIKVQQAKLSELRAGTQQEEIDVQQVKVDNAMLAHQDARKNLVVQLKDAYTKADNAVRNHVDQFISNAQGISPQVDFTVTDGVLETTVESSRVAIEVLLVAWQSSVDTLSEVSDLEKATAEAENNLDTVKSFLNSVSLVVNMLKTNSTISQVTIDGYRADVATARTDVNKAIGNVQDAEEKEKDEIALLALAEQELRFISAAPRAEKIDAQEAEVEAAEASALQYESELAKTILRAPLNGVIATQDTNVGEVVLAQEIIVSLISDAEFEIEVNIPEADIADVAVGDVARVTLDAYGNDAVFMATVTSIDPAETILEGVATYLTKLAFKEKDERVRSGMTANIDIETGVRKDVIAVPTRAVVVRDGEKIVRRMESNGELTEVPVVTGLRGSDGRVEIAEGVAEGDRVVIYIKL